MKSLLIIVFLFCVAGASFAQRVPSSCDAPDSIKKHYREDAAQLAYEYEQETNSPYLDSATISQDLEDRFMRALLAVYNTNGLLQADTVTTLPLYQYDQGNLSTFQTFHSILFSEITLNADTTTFLWEKRLVNRQFPTGNTAFDSLLSQYEITFDSIYYSSVAWLAVFRKPYNVIVLDSLINIAARPGNFVADVAGYIGDGEMMAGELHQDSTVTLIYSAGWDDCFAGCIYRRYWHFTVFPDCSVRFDSSYGNAWPQSGVVFDAGILKKDLMIYPNPTSKILIVETQLPCIIEILDLQGKVLESLFSKDEKIELDISFLPKGIYFVRATDKNG